jgi:hypothetical protein
MGRGAEDAVRREAEDGKLHSWMRVRRAAVHHRQEQAGTEDRSLTRVDGEGANAEIIKVKTT